MKRVRFGIFILTAAPGYAGLNSMNGDHHVFAHGFASFDGTVVTKLLFLTVLAGVASLTAGDRDPFTNQSLRASGHFQPQARLSRQLFPGLRPQWQPGL